MKRLSNINLFLYTYGKHQKCPIPVLQKRNTQIKIFKTSERLLLSSKFLFLVDRSQKRIEKFDCKRYDQEGLYLENLRYCKQLVVWKWFSPKGFQYHLLRIARWCFSQRGIWVICHNKDSNVLRSNECFFREPELFQTTKSFLLIRQTYNREFSFHFLSWRRMFSGKHDIWYIPNELDLNLTSDSYLKVTITFSWLCKQTNTGRIADFLQPLLINIIIRSLEN